MGAFQETVTLINRTKRMLSVRFDGQDHDIMPGENPGFPVIAVEHAKAQNPLMGSQHPYDPGDYKSLIAVKGVRGEDCSPIDNDPDEVERVDRNKVFGKYSKKNTQRIDAGGVSNFEAKFSTAGGQTAVEFGKA